jgi:hypothetical protein
MLPDAAERDPEQRGVRALLGALLPVPERADGNVESLGQLGLRELEASAGRSDLVGGDGVSGRHVKAG